MMTLLDLEVKVKLDTCKRFTRYDFLRLFSHLDALEPIIKKIYDLFSMVSR